MAITDTRQELIRRRKYEKGVYGRQCDIYLSNYPQPAKYLAERIGNSNKFVAELCCGVGITTRELAAKFQRVVAVDNDKTTLKYCLKNLKMAGVLGKVELICGDVNDIKVLKRIKTDIVVYDIPYWVPKNFKDGKLNIDMNPHLKKLVNNIRKFVSRDIVVFSPPWQSYDEVKKILGECEFQQVFINEKHDRNYIYYGDLVKNPGITRKKFKI